jgi:NADPH2:quinone reductase
LKGINDENMKVLHGFSIPEQMSSLVLEQFDRDLVLQAVDVPKPGKGEILIRMDSSPINPSDNSFLKGNYGSKKLPPVIAGFEGSGKVVATGRDFMSARLLGKQVACFAPPTGNGTWAEFMLTGSKLAIPLKRQMDLEQGSMLMVNPLSVMAMLDIARKMRCRAIANTAAASALGQMLNHLCIEQNLTLVNIVRRQEQLELLHQKGAKHVLDSSESNFKKQMADLFNELKVSLAFDAIAGQSTYDLLEALPDRGEVMVYGGLSEKPMSVHPGNLIFEGKKVTGFWLSDWVAHQPLLKLLRTFGKIQKIMTHSHKTTISRRVTLQETQQGLHEYLKNMTAGKVLVKPSAT